MKIKEIIGVRTDLCEMSNLRKKETGIQAVIYCGPKGDANHECRVKVSNLLDRMDDSDCFSIQLKDLTVVGTSKLPSDLMRMINDWIKANRFAILDLWKYRITFKQFLARVTKYKTR